MVKISSREPQCVHSHTRSRQTRTVGVFCHFEFMTSHQSLANSLASAFLVGNFNADEFIDRGAKLLGKKYRWLRPLARSVIEKFPAHVPPRAISVVEFILADAGFQRACDNHDLDIIQGVVDIPKMSSAGPDNDWDVPAIRSPGELAQWLGVTLGELDWFANLHDAETHRTSKRLQHYNYRILKKDSNSVRLIEAPKSQLKEFQQLILSEILNQIPPHEAAHGFRRGRSIRTFVAPHIDRGVVLKMDLEDFFPSIEQARIQAMFRTAGYPERVADYFAGFCTNRTPYDVWPGEFDGRHCSMLNRYRRLYGSPHLPQGAPTSPSIANLVAYRMDCRLQALSKSANANYTRYADDLAFSGDKQFARVARRFLIHVAAIVLEEGFDVNHHKTRIMRAGSRQKLAGIIVNEKPNVQREEFDQLKAILTNCIRNGRDSQNRSNHDHFREHLEGRLSFFESINPKKAKKLRRLFEQIVWSLASEAE